MKRRLLDLLAALSLLLLATTVALWAVFLCYPGEHFAGIKVAGLALGPVASDHLLGFRVIRPFLITRPLPPPTQMTGGGTFSSAPAYSGRFGFYLVRSVDGNMEFQADKVSIRGAAATSVLVPYWFLMALAAIVPALWLAKWRRQRNDRRLGLCSICRYDLRAHLTGGAGDRCPECGTPIAAPPASNTAAKNV